MTHDEETLMKGYLRLDATPSRTGYGPPGTGATTASSSSRRPLPKRGPGGVGSWTGRRLAPRGPRRKRTRRWPCPTTPLPTKAAARS